MSSDLQDSAVDTDGPSLSDVDPLDEQFDDESSYEYGQGYEQYRTLSVAAVTTLIFGILSLAVISPLAVFTTILILPAAGTLLGLFAVWTVYSRPEEFTGQPMAVAGLGLSGMTLAAGIVLNYQFNHIEVPADYQGKEVYFWELQPDEPIDLQYLMRMRGRDVDLPLPERAKSLDGQKVFVTGYVYPGAQRNGLKKFVLVPDKGTCCFGGQPKLTDMIEVTLADPLRIDYSFWRRGVGGTLKVHSTMQSRDQLTGVVYQLEADYLSEGPGETGYAGL